MVRTRTADAEAFSTRAGGPQASGPSGPAAAARTAHARNLGRREKLLERRAGLSPAFGWVGMAIVAIVTGYPLLMLFLRTLVSDGLLSLEGFRTAFGSLAYLQPFWNTLFIGGATTALALLIGVPLALVLGRVQIPAGRLLRTVLLLPYLIPAFVFAFAWRELLGPVGYLNRIWMALSGSKEPLFSLYGPAGIILIMVLHSYPTVYIVVVRALKNMNASLEQAAEVSGAGRMTVLRTITLPLMAPAVLGAALLVFSSTIANFGVPAVLGIPVNFYVLTTQIYSVILSYGVKNNLSIAACLSLYLIVAGLLFLWLQERLTRRRSHVVVTGKGGRRELMSGGRRAWVLSVLLSIFGLVTVVLPLSAILLSSFTRAYGLPPTFGNLSLRHFTGLLHDTLAATALKNSLVFASVTATLCVALGFLVAAVTERTRMPGKRLLDFLATAPRSIPGTVVALAFIIAWIRPVPGLGFSIYNTAAIIILAFLSKFLGYAVRSVSASMKQISVSLEEACLVSGGRSLHRLRDILLPLSLEGIASGWLLVFIPALNELTISLLLYSSGKETIGVAVFTLLQEGRVGRSSAFSVVIILTVIAGDRLLHWITRGKRSLLQ